jgi:hypothetical protein
MATLPKQRSESARKDPEPRPVSGVPYGGIDVLNRDPSREYRLIDEGSGSGREVICPQLYEEMGWVIEHWPSFQGLEAEELKKAQLAGLRFAGQKLGRAGEPMVTRGHVLMSIDREELAARTAEAQKSVDPIEEAIVGESAADAYLQQAKQGMRERPRARQYGVEKWE